MVKRMLIDATHREETRVVVLDGTRLDEFDVETSTKKQIKGNIYLAKVVRVEPSLQAAFVDYGGNRHGFLAFSEIHPDYYQIPVADRERLLAEAARHEEEEDRRERERHQRRQRSSAPNEAGGESPTAASSDGSGDHAAAQDWSSGSPDNAGEHHNHSEHDHSEHDHGDHDHGDHDHEGHGHEAHGHEEAHDHGDHDHGHSDHHDHGGHGDHGEDTIPLAFIPPAIRASESSEETDEAEDADAHSEHEHPEHEASLAFAPAADSVEQPGEPTLPGIVSEGGVDAPPGAEGDAGAGELKQTVETIGGEDPDEEEDDESDKQRRRFVASRHYKIQEVIKRRQIMLVQVVKEERGNKGAALTTYLSLAGRYCVLMPNSARGGGVSRKITSAQDRRRLKQIVGDLELPKNMAVILRTAGAERSKPEIKRDYEYLQRTWNNIREVTMQSRAPALIHEEASLIKRAIRDIYSRDIEEVWVEGDDGYKTAKDFMRMLTPSHARKVQRYKDDLIPLFHRYQVESQMETINSPVVQLRSGGSIVFNQTEALVAIDVNSGRATRERHIEETAYKTNVEAAEEIARQLRLRDLAGLVVIDFIDMEDNRNNHAVERRLKDALKVDRARIQVGRISHFGLLELSRQRLRPSLIETNFRVCAHCAGTGLIRSTESAAVHTLRMIEEEGVRRRSSELTVTVNPEVALYILNYKREMLAAVESRYGIKVYVLGDAALIAPNLRIDRIKALRGADEPGEAAPAPVRELAPPVMAIEEEPEIEDDEEEEQEPRRDRQEHRADGPRPERQGDREEGDGGRKRRRRRRRRRGEGQPREPRDGQSHEGQSRDGQSQGLTQGEAVAPRTAEPAESTEQPVLSEGEGERPEQQAGEGGRDGEARRGRRRGRRGGRRRRRENGFAGEGREGANGSDTAGEPIAQEPIESAFETPFPTDRAHPAAATVHPDETYQPPRVEAPSTTADATEPQGNGERKSFFRGLFGRRNEPQPEARVDTSPPPPPPVTPAMTALPAAPVIAAAPPPPPPPPPSAVEEPAGPPRRGWWQQPNKTE